MKKLGLLLCAFILSATTAQASIKLEYDGATHDYDGSIYELLVNGETIKTPLEPIIFNSRALVPVREVFEAMGAKVNYIDKNKEVDVIYNDEYIRLNIGSVYAYVNSEKIAIPDGVKPMIIAKAGGDGKTMIPVRFVSETLGFNVGFDGVKNIISITDPKAKIKPVNITDVKAVQDGKNEIVTVTFSAKPQNISKLTYVSSSGVLYCDVENSNIKVKSFEVNRDTVKNIRFGTHETYSRIAIDTENVGSYKHEISADGKTLTITIIPGDGTSTPKPQTPTDNTKTDTDTDTKPVTPTTPTKPKETPQAHITGEKIVVIDAGHGGSDPGAGSTFTDEDGSEKFVEKEINLAVATKVANILKANGISVKMTRTGDTYPSLSDRSDLANEIGASMFVSIHSNAIDNNPEINGIEVYYASTNNDTRYGVSSSQLAKDIYKNLIDDTKATPRNVKTEQHYVTRTSEMPAVLIEIGFITNKTEAENLANSGYQDKLANAIANGIMKNLKNIKLPPEPKPEPEKQTQPEGQQDEN